MNYFFKQILIRNFLGNDLNGRHKMDKESRFALDVEGIFETNHKIVIAHKIEANTIPHQVLVGQRVGGDIAVVDCITDIGIEVQVKCVVELAELVSGYKIQVQHLCWDQLEFKIVFQQGIVLRIHHVIFVTPHKIPSIAHPLLVRIGLVVKRGGFGSNARCPEKSAVQLEEFPVVDFQVKGIHGRVVEKAEPFFLNLYIKIVTFERVLPVIAEVAPVLVKYGKILVGVRRAEIIIGIVDQHRIGNLLVDE